MKRLAISLALAALGISSAYAEDSTRFGLGVQASTAGAGFDAAYKINDILSARVGYSGLTYTAGMNISGVDYSASLKLSSLRALADIALGRGFRFSTGVYVQNNKVDLHGRPFAGLAFNINGTTYQSSDIGDLSGEVKFANKFAPYLGLGFGSLGSREPGLSFYADVGAMYQGKAQATLNANCGTGLVGALSCEALKADVAREEENINNHLDHYKWYPVVGMGVYYNF